MPYWAELNADNVVVAVIVMDADDDADGVRHPPTNIEAHASQPGTTWQRTYYASRGHTYAGIGYTWDPDLADFVPPPRPEDVTP